MNITTSDSLSVHDAVKEKIIKRQNFGVIFRYIKPIFTYTDHYVHHLILDLPPRQMNASSDLIKATHPSEMNKRPTDLIHNLTTVDPLLQAMRQEVLQIQHLVDSIYDLFVEVDPSAFASRKRRYWCIFYCSDVATQTDMDIIKKYNEDAGNTTARNFDKIQKSLDAMASYSKMTDQKFEALKYIIERQQYNAQMGAAALKSTQVFVGVLTNLFLPNALHLTNLRHALVLLKHNILTFEVLSLTQARAIMRQIKQHIRQWPMRFIVFADPLSLYKEADISYFRTAASLHIGLRVKVSYFQQPLHLFRVEKFELAFPNQGHTTVIQDLPEFIAINDYDSEYLVFSKRPMMQKDKFYFLENMEHELLSKTAPTCVTALFHDKLSAITKLCETFLQPFSDKPVLRYVGANLILLKKISSYQIITSANTSLTVASNCSACLKTVPCGSRIQAGAQMTLIPLCPVVLEWQKSQPPAHILNLQVLGPLLDASLLRELSTEFTFNNPINVTLPNVTVFQPQNDQKLSDAFRTLGMQTIHLTTAINQSLEKGIIFQSSADHIVYKISQEGFAYSVAAGWESFKNFFTNPFQIFTKLDMLLQWVALAYLFYRVRILGAALAVRHIAAQTLKEANDVHARKLEDFIQRLNTVPQTSSTFDYKPQLSEQYHVVDILIFLTLVAIGLYLVSQFTANHLRRNTMQIFAHIISSQEDVMVKLLTLPHRSQFYRFQANNFVQAVSVTGFLLPELHIIWPSFTIQHKLLRRNVNIPSACHINFYQAVKLRRILVANFELLIFAKDSDSQTFRLIPLEGSVWQQVQVRQTTPPDTTTQLWFTNRVTEDNSREFV
jgi:hypothetical protein